jgi:hypothetical protein
MERAVAHFVMWPAKYSGIDTLLIARLKELEDEKAV